MNIRFPKCVAESVLNSYQGMMNFIHDKHFSEYFC